jgi:hypothetical protein
MLDLCKSDVLDILHDTAVISIASVDPPSEVTLNDEEIADALWGAFYEANDAAIIGLATAGAELVRVCQAADPLVGQRDNLDTQRYVKTRDAALARVLECLP